MTGRLGVRFLFVPRSSQFPKRSAFLWPNPCLGLSHLSSDNCNSPSQTILPSFETVPGADDTTFIIFEYIHHFAQIFVEQTAIDILLGGSLLYDTFLKETESPSKSSPSRPKSFGFCLCLSPSSEMSLLVR